MNSESGASNMAMEGIVSSSSNNKNSSVMNNTMMVVVQSNSNDSQNSVESNPNNRSSRRKALWKKRQRRSARKQASGGRLGGRRQRRLWQLPESSIMEYQQWIQDKPEADRTPSEERFLWKCMIRSLGVVGANPQHTPGKRGRHERIREFVDRLEQKEPLELTKNEEDFIRLYRKRQQDRRAQRLKQKKQQQQQDGEGEQVVSWMRNDENSNNGNNHNVSHQHKGKKKNKNNKGFEPSASLESLRESMKNMGLNSDKLKQVRFAEPAPMK